MMSTNLVRYKVGIDVGLYSVGFAAIEVDENDTPIQFLNSVVHIHDAGVDPLQAKTAKTRLAESGVARRVRRMQRRRRKRLYELDRVIAKHGWPIISLEDESDPWLPWKVRAQLASERISDPKELGKALSIALRHMARHRGWRNPWTSVKSLTVVEKPSEFLERFQGRVADVISEPVPVDATAAQLVMFAKTGPSLKLRGDGGLLGGKLHQSDNVLELRAIAEKQGISREVFMELVEAVFKAESPRGSFEKHIGRDVLPGREKLPRAAKSSLAFQRFRIAALVGNVRVLDDSGVKRVLSTQERQKLFEYLDSIDTQPSWSDVAAFLDIKRRSLSGVAQEQLDGDLVSTRPPVNRTEQLMSAIRIKSIRDWWKSANDDEKEALVRALSNNGTMSESNVADLAAGALIESLSEDDLAKLDQLNLPSGRAAFSERSLRELTDRILSTEDDLHTARKNLFGIDDNWRPPVEAIGEPVGNPAVDRVLRIVARWLYAAEKKWGAPLSVNVEHVREALGSVASARDLVRQQEKRFRQKRAEAEDLRNRRGIQGEIRNSDVRRLQAITRQNGQCLYCGATITLDTMEMDHIVPRAGVGSTNTRTNLVAVCRSCNANKSNTLFSLWAQKSKNPNVSLAGALQRVDNFIQESGMNNKEFADFKKAVKSRLTAKELDDPVDARSIESVAWMANQLHLRIAAHFQDSGTDVKVYRGAVTAWARKASGIEKRIEFIGGSGKSRLDRRHHAIDASVTALMRHSVAQTLAERDSLMRTEWETQADGSWKRYTGVDIAAQRIYAQWCEQMEILVELLNQLLREDRIPVVEGIRLKLGNSAAHDDTVKKLDKRKVGDELPLSIIDKASTPALWCALTRHADFDPEAGLPANPDRRIRLHDKQLGPDDEVAFFGPEAPIASILVRGGSADIGNTIHHARIYRVTQGKRQFFAMLRVFATDLARHANADLFAADIPPQAISVRAAEPRLRLALAEGRAEYLGWIVEGDELLLDMSSQTKGHVGEFLAEFPGTTRWRLAGFPSVSKLRLRPRLLAGEGIVNLEKAKDGRKFSAGTHELLLKRGWWPSVDVVFGSCDAVVIRRDVLGRVRLESDAHLPVSWGVKAE